MELERLIGRTFDTVRIVTTDGDDAIEFATDGRVMYRLSSEDYEGPNEVHVEIIDLSGDIEWLAGSPILRAEVVSNTDEPPPPGRNADSYTWSFARLTTIKGTVVARFYGSSNGFYSEYPHLYVIDGD